MSINDYFKYMEIAMIKENSHDKSLDPKTTMSNLKKMSNI